MIYLLGDSHATEIARSWMDKTNHVSWKTLLGYGLQGIVQNSPKRNPPQPVFDGIIKTLSSIEKKSRLILSYTDADGRIGMSDTGINTLMEDYSRSLDLVFELSSPTSIVILDWYGIVKTQVSEQTCSVAQRLKNRESQLGVLEKLSEKFNIQIDTTFGNLLFEDKEGFSLDGLMGDGVHYNFSHELPTTHLFPKYAEYVKFGY